MEASTSKEHTAFVSMPKDKHMKPESKHGGMEVLLLNSKNNEGGSVRPHSDDATASSSSFSNTYSDHGTGRYESDNEVVSDLRGDAASMCGFGGSGDFLPLRKQRVTSHWRKFVQPITWRCKWVELQLKKFESMAVMYDKEIEKHNQTKELKYRNFELEGCCARSMPFVPDSQRQKLMKRKIRKRHEESDTELYMLHHNISSYLATCRSPAHGPTMDDDETSLGPSSPKNACNEFIVPDELLCLDFRDGYSLEHILWKIEGTQSQVSKMKSRIDIVTTENAGRISLAKDLILKESNNQLSRPIVEPDVPTDMKGPSTVATFASQLMKSNTGHDVVKPENAASDFTRVQDANEPMGQPRVASRKRSMDGILIYNRRAKKPQTDSGIVKIHSIEMQRVSEEEKNNYTAHVAVSEDSSQNEQPAPKIRSISKLTRPKSTKRRAARARRKSGSSLWSQRTSG